MNNKNLNNNKLPSILQIGNLTVEIEYAENNKTLSECILNILMQKSKMY